MIERYLANAGSGKTHALSGAWLRVAHKGLVQGDPDRMTSILATTFTRAAARDILAKILVRLAEGVLSQDKRNELAKSIFGNDDGHAVRAEELLEAVITRIDRVEVRTLDSLLMRMARAYALELGIGTHLSPLDEVGADAVLRESLARVLRDQSIELARILRVLRLGEDRVDSIEQTFDSARALLGAWQDSGGSDDPDNGVPDCWLGPESAKRIDSALARAAVERAAEGLKELGETHKKIAEYAAGKYLDVVRAAERGSVHARACQGYLEDGALNSVAEGKDHFYKRQFSKSLHDDLQMIVDWLRGEILHARLVAHQESARLAALLVRNEQDALRQRGVCTFESITRSIAVGMNDGCMAEILMRLDQQIHHLLLDEFQDTSLSQWQALKPLAINLAAGGDEPRSILVVGDIKQSIYGWRSGDPRLLRGLSSLLSDGGFADVQERVLATSWRSAPLILEAVDAVFHHLKSDSHPIRNLAQAGGKENFVNALDAWLEGYQVHYATERNRQLAGSVVLTKCPTRKERLDKCARQAVELWNRCKGGLRIAVIHHKNTDASEVAERIRSLPGSPGCSLRAKGSLSDSAVVLAFLDAIRLAAHPRDRTAFLSVLMSPIKDVWGVGVESAHPWPEQRKRSHDASKELLRKFSRETVVGTLNAWRVSLAKDGLIAMSDRRRLDRALHVIARAERAGSTLDEIVEAVEQEDCRDVEGQPIESITIHQAKGLEWDVVIFGAPTRLLGRRPKEYAVERNLPYRGIGCDRVSPTVPSSARSGAVKEVNDSAERFDCQDKLSALYVALTRAKRGLFIVVDQKPSGKGKSPEANASHGSILIEALENSEFLVRAGDQSWMDNLQAIPAVDLRQDAPQLPPAPQVPRRGLAAEIASRQVAQAADVDVADFSISAAAQRAALDRGTLAHAVCEHLEWSDEWQPDVEAIARGIEPSVTYRDSVSIAACVRETVEQLRAPDIMQALKRPAGGAVALRERRFLALLPSGRVQEGAIDRLVLRGEPGSWKHLQIVDFKTDQPPAGTQGFELDAWIRDRVEHHKPQLTAYCHAMAPEYGVPIAQCELLLVLLACGRAVVASPSMIR
jgi:ATP-dependent exoDNAse (exonuclease V) beta subunit